MWSRRDARFTRRGAGSAVLFAATAAVVVSAIVISAVLIPGLSSSGTQSAASPSGSGVDATTSVSNESMPSQEPAPTSVSCITVIPYDSIQKQFAGCGYTFSVLFNGNDYTQSANGTVGTNLGWTLLIGVSQDCRCGPSENATFGWDPAGPLSAAPGERLPVPASSTLFGGNLTMQWRLYGSPALLYAWITASTISALQQATSAGSTTTSCPTATWPSAVSTSYRPAVQQIEQNPAFTALTNGLCYSLALNDYGESGGQSLTTFIFNQYNGTIYYPCGTFPANFIVSQIQVTVLNGSTTNEVSSMWLENETGLLDVYNCPGPTLPPVLVHSVTLTSPYTPAGPTVNVTLYASLEQLPITNLTTVLSLTGRNQTFQFGGISASSPLMAGEPASQTEIVAGPVSIDTNAVYPMTITGAFQNGQAFSYAVQVEIQSSPH